MQKNLTELFSHTMYTNKPKIDYLSVSFEIMKLLEESVHFMPFDIDLCNIFLICLLMKGKQTKINKYTIATLKRLAH